MIPSFIEKLSLLQSIQSTYIVFHKAPTFLDFESFWYFQYSKTFNWKWISAFSFRDGKQNIKSKQGSYKEHLGKTPMVSQILFLSASFGPRLAPVFEFTIVCESSSSGLNKLFLSKSGTIFVLCLLTGAENFNRRQQTRPRYCTPTKAAFYKLCKFLSRHLKKI